MPAGTSPFQIATGSTAWLDTPLIRRAGREVLSLALMDARNHTLQLTSQIERGIDLLPAADHKPECERALWLLRSADDLF